MATDLDLQLVKELSTVGELISLTDRPIRRQSEARSESILTSRSEGARRSRSRDRRRSSGSKSVSPIDGRRRRSTSLNRRDSVYSPTKGTPFSRKNSINNLIPLSRRGSTSLSRRSSLNLLIPSPENRGSPTKNLKSSRRESMLNILRGELEKIPCVLAVHKRRQSPDKEPDKELDEDGVFLDSETDDDASSRTSGRRTLRRQSSLQQLRRSSSITPAGLSEAEIRKLQMIQTLNQMGVTPRGYRKNSMASISGEAAVMEASYGTRKRGSIATRVMLVANTRNHPPDNKSYAKEKSSSISDAEEMSDDSKQKSQKVLDLLKKPEKLKLPGLVGKKSASTEDVAVESMNAFRRKLRRKKLKPKEKFRKLSRFLLLLLRAWRIHSNAINDVLVSNNNSLDMITTADNSDLLFDITKYKAVKEAKVSQEAIRVLKKKPKLRTEEEKYYIQIALRNYKSIAEYPVKMQKMIAQRSWYESYDPKRVIVREGHVPMCFYFILSGSAVVSTSDGGSQRTVMFLNRGDSFGDVAILNGSRRETTVISREKIELLVMGDTDFIDIFMSGGISDPDDPFLKSISFLDGWPVAKLIENPKKCIFSFFKRGTVLVQDSHNSDWIFIIRSGSASIMKKLQTVNVQRVPKVAKKMDFREEVMCLLKNESYLSHEDQITLLHEEEKRGLEDQNLLVRYYALPEINVATNDGYNELKQMREEYMNQNSLNRVMAEVENLQAEKGDDTKSEAGNSSATGITTNSKRRKMSMNSLNLSNMVSKGPFMLKSRGGHRQGSSSSRRSSMFSRRSSITENENQVDSDQKVDDWQGMSLPITDEPNITDLRQKIRESKSVFVEVQNLTKGQTFGLAEMLFEGQPDFSLVSNGAECVMIDKKFFMEHASHSLIVQLKGVTYPYPSNEALQENLESQMRWDHHKKKELNKMLRTVKINKADKHDARALLQIPALKA